MSTATSLERAVSAARRPSLWSPAVAVLLGCGLVLALTADKAVAVWSTGIFHNPDDAMRAVEIRDLLAGQGWFDMVQHRLAPGHGVPMHWSRLADLPVAGLVALFRGLLGFDVAERLARLVEPVALLVGFMICQARLGRILLGVRGPLAACLLAAGGIETVGTFIPGHIHHHGLQVTLLMALAVLIVEDVAAAERRVSRAALAGGVAALTLAINLQNLPFVVVAIAALGLGWIGRGMVVAPSLRGFAFALMAGTAAAFLIQVPFDRWTAGTCDAFGAPHLLAAWLGGTVLLALSALSRRLPTPGSRGGAALALGLGLAALLRAAYPECLGDPYAGVDPLLRSRWLADVSEAMPLADALRRNLAGTLPIAAALSLGAAAIAFAWLRSAGSRRAQWAAVAGFTAAGIAGTLWEVRVAASAEPFAALGAAWVLCGLFDPARPRPPLAALLCVVCGLALTQAGWASALTSQRGSGRTAGAGPQVDAAACSAPSAYAGLAGLAPGVVMSTIDPGSQILAFTPHAVLAAPYHRNTDGNLASIRFFDAGSDGARAIAHEAAVRYVVLCLTSPEVVEDAALAPDGVAARVLRGETPDWLRPSGAASGPVRVFEVAP